MALQTSTGADLVDSSFADAQAVTPNDTIGAAQRLRNVRGIWADAAGTISVITQAVAAAKETKDGTPPLSAANAVSFTLLAGQVLPLNVAYVLLTGTSATGIKALF